MEYVNTSYQAYDKVTERQCGRAQRQIETLCPLDLTVIPNDAPSDQLDVVIILTGWHHAGW